MAVSHFKSSDAFNMNTFNNKLDEISGSFAPPPAVGDLLFTTRDDVGDEWLNVSKNTTTRISDNYPELQKLFPIDFTKNALVQLQIMPSDSSNERYVNRLFYYNNKYWYCDMTDDTSKYTIAVYSTDDIFSQNWKVEKTNVDVYNYSGGRFITTHVAMYNGNLYCFMGHNSKINGYQDIYYAVVPLGNIANTQWTKLDTYPSHFGTVFNEATNKWNFVSVEIIDSAYNIFLCQSDNFIVTDYDKYKVINQTWPSSGTAYAIGTYNMNYYKGFVYGMFTTQRGYYCYAAPANDISKVICNVTTNQNSSSNRGTVFYSKNRGKVVSCWFEYSSGGSTTTWYDFDGTNWNVITGANAICPDNVIELADKTVLWYSGSNYIYNNIFDGSAYIEKTDNVASSSPIGVQTSQNLKDSKNIIQNYGSTSNYNAYIGIYQNYIPQITLTNANVYIRAK